ncbi:TrmB family transcriptional regulator [Halalkalibacter okhensis]|uniref:Transcriptional regulator n=1 Tax=Halalkalibacter okhensis TaxID=333138 RepID=A0A0B0IH68_9BACI|nr:helix-turn-helix domain-containing protein [Halalkalibacter okhensis]KHF39369.1 hypothetical protein LQ50_15890 [Halalkalibacter okhensis]
MKKDKIINSLKMNGFTEYEAKIYISLLKSFPANGNMIANDSGVPGPKVYETLRKMEDKGYVFLVSDGDKKSSKRYSPLPYKDLLAFFEKGFNENKDILETSLEEIANSGDQEWTEIFRMEGYETSIEAIASAIDNSSSKIYLSCWSKEFTLLYPTLLAAHERGVKIVTMIFDEPKEEIYWPTFTHHKRLREILHIRHSNELNIVLDERKVIVFEIFDDLPSAVVSSHKAMIETTKKYIRHDIYVNRVIHDLGDQLVTIYGEKFERLIDDF